jgi:hypothetical protein
MCYIQKQHMMCSDAPVPRPFECNFPFLNNHTKGSYPHSPREMEINLQTSVETRWEVAFEGIVIMFINIYITPGVTKR